MWQSPSPTVILADEEVHVWGLSLGAPPSVERRFWRLLPEDERRRAKRFSFEHDRVRFVMAHGLLRIILSRYTRQLPAEIRFHYSDHGKPMLTPEPNTEGLRFNLSHSYALGLVAVTRGREIGVDVERVRPEVACEQIARRYFSPREAAAFAALPASAQPEAFFACWARKEAYVKARGEGLSFSLDAFDVSFTPGERPPLLSVGGDHQRPSLWKMEALEVDRGYQAAVVAEGQSWRLRCWDSLGVIHGL